MKLLAFIGFLFVFTIHAQVDFNNYTTLQSKGDIPEDFTSSTYLKLKKDIEVGDDELNSYERKVFYEGVNYAIDDILHSGYVIYGDEITDYLNKIADKLLKKDKKLRSELRFYTLKSNSVNAFSTDQGIVFVTTGLISQITSEAQLAFILAHEISHYTEHHVVETFSHKKKNRRQSIEQLSVYSKEKEFSADKIGLELYQKAGYSKDEVLPTFDVLMYSYLPFDEIEIESNYFHINDSIYIPKSIFPDEKFEIKAQEDEDDSKSSHPNIKKRKEGVKDAFDNLTESRWKDDVNSLGDEKFIYIRTIARFESIRNDIIEAKFGKALYSLFLLEKDHPETMYLERMKAQIWLGLLMYRLENEISHTIIRKSEYEGESASIHYMIRNLNKDELEAFSLAQLYEIAKTNQNDPEISLIWDLAIKTIVYADNFNISDFSTNNYYHAKYLYNQTIIDTVTVVEEEKPKEKGKSKYDRIKTKRDVSTPESFDSTKFYIYLLSEIIKDDFFLNVYDKYKDEYKDEEKEEEELEALSYKEQRKIYKQAANDRLKVGIDELIVVEPTVLSYKSRGVDRVKSEKMEKEFSEAILESSEIAGLKIFPVDRLSLDKNGTIGFNERSILLNMVSQIFVNDDIEPFPVDYQLLQEIHHNYGTSKVMFSLVEHRYMPNLSFSGVFTGIIFFPIGLVYIPLTLLAGNNTEINLIVLDTKNAKIIASESHYIKDTANKHVIGSHLYSIFSQLKLK